MLPAPIWPLAEHASFGQNCCDASIGSVVLFIIHSMPLDACFFQALLTFSPVSGELPDLNESNLHHLNGEYWLIWHLWQEYRVIHNRDDTALHLYREFPGCDFQRIGKNKLAIQ